MFLFDVSEECGVGEVPFAAGASKFSLSLLFGFDGFDWIMCTSFLAH